VKTKTIGELLVEQRMRAGLTIETVAAQTRVKLEYLHAIERNDFTQLPAAVFVKGFIRSYARVLELDPHPLLALLRRDYKTTAHGALRPQDIIVSTTRQPRMPRTLRLLMIGTVVLAGVLGTYVAWQWLLLNRPPEVIITHPSELTEVEAQFSVMGRTAANNIVTVNGQSVPLKPDGFFVAEVELPKIGIATVVIEARDPKGKSTVVERQVRVKTD
jgi:cytoskeletal protein RodZ